MNKYLTLFGLICCFLNCQGRDVLYCDPEFDCLIYDPNPWIPNPSDCFSYYDCSDPYDPYDCEPGYYFSADSYDCEPCFDLSECTNPCCTITQAPTGGTTSGVGTTADPGTEAPTDDPTGTLTPSPGDCSDSLTCTGSTGVYVRCNYCQDSYWLCDDAGDAELRYCEDGYVFNPEPTCAYCVLPENCPTNC